jgi:hypothetical protein
MLTPQLMQDLREFATAGGTEGVIAVRAFLVLVWGDERRGIEPNFGDGARTIWRIDGDGQPVPYLEVFDWGGGHLGIPALRVWCLQRSGNAPQGIGAFIADGVSAAYPERETLQRRLAALLSAPGLSFVIE